MTPVLTNALKVSVVLLVALMVTLALRRQSAALRHWVLALAIVAGALMPAVAVVAASWRLDLDRFGAATAVQPRQSPAATSVFVQPTDGSVPVSAPADRARSQRPNATTLLSWTWLAGAIVAVSMLLVGFVRLHRLAARARRVNDRTWSAIVRQAATEYGLKRRVLLLQSDHPALLVTWGLIHPKLLLPASAIDWPVDRVRTVVYHELAHVGRRDWIVQIAGELLRAIYWFNPLVWIVCRRLRRESEYACDDAVLGAGVRGEAYASHLVEIARILNAERHVAVPAPAMARPSTLEGRIRAMLNPTLNRTRPTRAIRIATLALLLGVMIPIAGLARQARFSVGGTVIDQTGRVLPDAVVIVRDTGQREKHEVRTDRAGRFVVGGLAPAEYELQVRSMGFATFAETIAIAGDDLDRTVQLQVGSLTETINVTDGPGTPAPAIPPDKTLAISAARAHYETELSRCVAADTDQVGGKILPPRKLVHVVPVYPESAKPAKTGGVVTMEAVIGTDGLVREVRIESSPSADLGRTAADAVRLWEFSPTLLNCTPVEVRMRVTTNFLPQ